MHRVELKGTVICAGNGISGSCSIRRMNLTATVTLDSTCQSLALDEGRTQIYDRSAQNYDQVTACCGRQRNDRLWPRINRRSGGAWVGRRRETWRPRSSDVDPGGTKDLAGLDPSRRRWRQRWTAGHATSVNKTTDAFKSSRVDLPSTLYMDSRHGHKWRVNRKTISRSYFNSVNIMCLSFLPEQLVFSREKLVLQDAKMGFRPCQIVITAQCTLVQSAVLRSHVVRPSVCPSVTLVDCDQSINQSIYLFNKQYNRTQ